MRMLCCFAFVFAACWPPLTLAQEAVDRRLEPSTAIQIQDNGKLTESGGNAEGLIKLDVVVKDELGSPRSGLTLKDFTLLDNNQPTKLLSFKALDESTIKPDPPVEVILVIDMLELPARLASDEREAVEGFLHKNGGQLAEPVSLFELAGSGLWAIGESSRDGNALADDLAHFRKINLVRSFPGSLRGGVPVSSTFRDPPSLQALKSIGQIAVTERRKPGRKLLVWVGPGWGIGTGAYAEDTSSKEDIFYTIAWFSTLLREARIALYSLAVGESDPHSQLYLDFLQGAQSPRRASFMNLYRKVLAVQSGGRVLDRSYDLLEEIENCVRDASVFYVLSFNPPKAGHPDEYRDLRVEVGQPGLTAHTNTGYYDQPYYSDQANPAIRRLTVEELEQLLRAAHGEPDGEIARQLSGLELTERMSSSKLTSWRASLHGKQASQALVALADASIFLDPPVTEMVAEAPPDAVEQRRIIALGANYVSTTIPKLPNFYARRTTARYHETPQFQKGNTNIGYEPLHLTEFARETVLYRNGAEIVDPATAKHRKPNAEDPYLITYGTFGPVLGLAHDVLAVPDQLTWSRWEQASGSRRAVFRYTIPAAKSRYQVAGCCLPEGDGTIGFETLAAYHGEITIEPTTGAVLSLEAEAAMRGFVPLARADIVIEYGPVEMGGKMYTCPVRSISIMRSRSVAFLKEWDQGFKTYGPFVTILNDMSFGNYHMFRADSHLLTGSDAAPGTSPPLP